MKIWKGHDTVVCHAAMCIPFSVHWNDVGYMQQATGIV